MGFPFIPRPQIDLPSEIPETNPYLEHIIGTFRGGILGPEYIVNWHHRLKTWYLHLWTIGVIRYLIIMEPPQYGKTEVGGVKLPGYIFKQVPEAVIGYMTYGQERANKISNQAKEDMQTPRYIQSCNELTVPESETNLKRWYNNLGGSYQGMGRKTGVDGEPFSHMMFDDLYKNQAEGLSPAVQKEAWETYQAIGMTRIPPDGRVLLYFKRWHTLDVIGRCLTDMEKSPYADQYEVLCFPAVITRENYHMKHPLDPREIGEPLWPFKHSAGELKAREIGLGTALFEAEYQQVPLNIKGMVINTDWFAKKVRHTEIPKNLKWFRYYRLGALEKNTIDQQNATCLIAKTQKNEFYVKELKIFGTGWAEANEMIKHTSKAERGIRVGIKNVNGEKASLVDNIIRNKTKGCLMKAYDAVDPMAWAADAKSGKIFLVEDDDTETFIEACQVYTGSGKDPDESLIQALAGAWNMIKSKRSVTQAMAAKHKRNPSKRRTRRWLTR